MLRSQRARLTLAWFIVSVPVIIAGCAVAPPATMIGVELAVLAREASPFFLLGTLVLLLPVMFLARGSGRQRLALALALMGSIAIDARPLIAARGVRDFSYSFRYAILGDGNHAPLRERRIAYRAEDGSPLELLVLRGAAEGPRPTVVVVYGGAWRAGSPVQAIDASRYLARRGYTVVAIDYRHAPAHRYPAQRNDIRRSLSLLRDSAASWGIDTARVGIVGRSAGGHLALLAAYEPPASAAPLRIRAVAAIYAPYDLEKSYYDVPHPDPIDVREVLRTFLGGAPDSLAALYRDASPSTYVRPGLPPTLLVYAKHDHLVEAKFGRAAAEALAAAGNRVIYAEVPWGEHGFDLLPNGLGSQLAIELLERFFHDNL